MTLQIYVIGITSITLLLHIIMIRLVYKCHTIGTNNTLIVMSALIVLDILLFFLSYTETNESYSFIYSILISVIAAVSFLFIILCRRCPLRKKKKVKEISELVDSIKSNLNEYNYLYNTSYID